MRLSETPPVSRMREIRTYGSVRAKAEWLSYSTNFVCQFRLLVLSAQIVIYLCGSRHEMRSQFFVRLEECRK